MSARLSNYIKSPFNYTGGKYRILNQIIPHFPSKIGLFLDVFAGGGNVFINSKASSFYVNDIDKNLINLFMFMKLNSFNFFISQCQKVIEDFGLSSTSVYGYEFYGTNSSLGVGVFNKSGYSLLKEHFNLLKEGYPREVIFFILICFGFNNQIRYNKNNFFNIPVGKRDLNKSILKNVENFCHRLQSVEIKFDSKSFSDIDFSFLSSNDFVYLDPPYLTSNASYNESGKWSAAHEEKLISLLDELIARDIKFGLSNMTKSGDVENSYLVRWIKSNLNSLSVFNISSDYTNSNYQKKLKNSISEHEIFLIHPPI